MWVTLKFVFRKKPFNLDNFNMFIFWKEIDTMNAIFPPLSEHHFIVALIGDNATMSSIR